MKNKIIIKTISGLTLVSMLTYTLPVFAYTKEETVYSKLDANGNSYQTIVSTHIKNEEAKQVIEDVSDLLNIENTNGYETFQKDGDTLVWNAQGKDIYYQGESKKDLPITCNITYELEGREISKEELEGKSGKVKIILEYSNQEAHQVNINGKTETIYTPFLVIAGTILDPQKNKNVTISSGKIMDDGSKIMAVGVAFPGLQESLKLSKDGITLPEKIEIEMEASEFEDGMIASFVTPKIIESKEDLEIFNQLEEIFTKVSLLKDASNQILEGAKTLKDGTDEYSAKKIEFNEAMEQISQGMNTASQNYNQIDNGIQVLESSSSTLENGAKQISQGTTAVGENLETIGEKLGELEQGSKKLEKGEAQLSQGVDKIINGVNKIKISDSSQSLVQLQELIKQNENTIQTLEQSNQALKSQLSTVDIATKEKLNAQIKVNTGMIELLKANLQAQKQTIQILKQSDPSAITELKEGLNSLKQGVQSLQQGNKELTNGITQIQKGTTTLTSKTKELEQGANSLYQGTKSFGKGTGELKSGSNQMKSGLTTLNNSTQMLKQADDQLTQGATTIKEGASSLYEGILQLNQEGIEPICKIITGEVKSLTKRAQKLGELSLEYQTYTQLEDGQDGSVQFILLVDSIKKESKQKEQKEEVILNSNENRMKKQEEE